MLSKNVLSSDETETLRESRNPTTVVTANGEAQTNEEAQVFVHGLDLFVTVQILDDTPAVLSSGELCEEELFMQSEKLRTSCCPWIVVKFWYQFVLCVATAGLVKYIRAT